MDKKIDYKKLVFSNPQYAFLQDDEHLGKNIILLTLGGSHAYGTNVKGSNLDLRGIVTERKNELLGLDQFEQFEDKELDTTVYSLRKIVPLLLECNPNCIEILATKPEHLLILNEEGKMFRDHIGLFLSQRAANSFGGYALNQLRRLQNALARDSYPQAQNETHILNSLTNQINHLKKHYQEFTDSEIHLYIDRRV